MNLSEVKKQCELHGQAHLLQFWDNLSPNDQKKLYDDIKSIDFAEMNSIFKKATSADTGVVTPSEMLPIEDDVCSSVTETDNNTKGLYDKATLDAISRNEVGVLLLAGGQGTRLGVPYPKGMYDIGLPSKKTLYQIQVERILKLEELTLKETGIAGKIKMYIMTSEHTKAHTEEFFREHKYFGMHRENVVLFEQRMIPCFDMNGKIILSSKWKVARAPDGNGGLYWALKHDEIINDIEKSGVKYLHVYCVDNVLVKVADPIFMGYAITKGAESANKVVEKAFPSEAVGVVCRVGGKVQVVEYSEISNELAEMRTADGKLAFKAGNICNHFFTTEFLKSVCDDSSNHQLPYHVAKKKIPFVNESGETISPTVPNGIKLEKFVFDVFQFSNNFVIWECLREEEFSPLKNAEKPGTKDTPSTARNSLFALHKRYIESSGGLINSNNNEGERIPNGEGHEENTDEKVICEISPLVSYAGENLTEIVKGKAFTSPLQL